MFDVFCQRRETRRNYFPNFFLDPVRVARAVDQRNAIWLASGQFSVRFADSLIKLGRLLFHPIRSTRFLHS